MGSPACGRGTISGGCKYHTGIANTIFGKCECCGYLKSFDSGGWVEEGNLSEGSGELSPRRK